MISQIPRQLSKEHSLNVRSHNTTISINSQQFTMSRRRDILRLFSTRSMDMLLNDADDFSIISSRKTKQEAGGNMKGNGINCWKNYAIKASFMQTKQNTE